MSDLQRRPAALTMNFSFVFSEHVSSKTVTQITGFCKNMKI